MLLEVEQTEKNSTVVLSQDFGNLVKCLSASLQDHFEPLKRQWIFVPSVSLKQWLLTRLATENPRGGIAGYKISTLEDFIRSQCPQMPTKLEMVAFIYLELEKITEVEEVIRSQPDARLELAKRLSTLFFSYGKYGAPPNHCWQKELFEKVHKRLPIHFLKEASFSSIKSPSVHFFGFDTLAPIYWEFLKKAPAPFFYLFSPSSEFWEDTRTDREVRFLSKRVKKEGVSIKEIQEEQEYFSQMPPLLSNLGALGRETVNFFDQMDVQFAYAPTGSHTVLNRLQKEIVSLEREQDFGKDSTIEVFRTGSSLITQVETVKQEILKLVKSGVKFSEILILAPNIQRFLPAIEFVFSESDIPYRFPHISIEKEAPYTQGIAKLIDVAKSWDEGTLKALFETPRFRKKGKSSWISRIFQTSLQWEEGIQKLLEKSTTLFPGPSFSPIGDLDLFEDFFQTLQSLKRDLTFDTDLTLAQWADKWEEIVQNYLFQDYQSEQDSVSANTFSRSIHSIKNGKISQAVPFEVVEEFLIQKVHTSKNGGHLHAVSCSSIESGSIVPAKAILLLGMDEESFPRRVQKTSLDLVKMEPDQQKVDRYLFLQALLNAKEYFQIFYGHISGVDGKEIGPAVPVQELISYLKGSIEVKTPKVQSSPLNLSPILSFNSPEPLTKGDEIPLLLSDLLSFSRHPWRYYLRKIERMEIEDISEKSFPFHQASLLKPSLKWGVDKAMNLKHKGFPGIFSEALNASVNEKDREIKKQLDSWGKKLTSLSILETAVKEEIPPIKLELENGQVVRITGKVPFCLEDGALHFGSDNLPSLLRTWPEILVTSIALSSKQIYFLKTGRIKEITNPEIALKKYVEYFLRTSSTLTPLIPDWADVILRDKKGDLSFDYDDNVNEWIFLRLKTPENFEDWQWLKSSFEELIKLYPERQKNEV